MLKDIYQVVLAALSAIGMTFETKKVRSQKKGMDFWVHNGTLTLGELDAFALEALEAYEKLNETGV